MRIYTDLETIPSQRNDVRDRIWSDITAPAQYKKPESIEKWLEENRDSAADEQWRRTALDGGYGEIVCICFAVDDAPISTLQRKAISEPESDLLASFFGAVRSALRQQTPTWVGHNIGFDLRFLHHRAVVCGVAPRLHLPYNAAAWSGRFVDTMFEWAGARERIKLTALCDILGIEADDDIDGSEVWDRFQAGDHEAIAKHCQADVERVRQIDKRLRWAA